MHGHLWRCSGLNRAAISALDPGMAVTCVRSSDGLNWVGERKQSRVGWKRNYQRMKQRQRTANRLVHYSVGLSSLTNRTPAWWWSLIKACLTVCSSRIVPAVLHSFLTTWTTSEKCFSDPDCAPLSRTRGNDLSACPVRSLSSVCLGVERSDLSMLSADWDGGRKEQEAMQLMPLKCVWDAPVSGFTWMCEDGVSACAWINDSLLKLYVCVKGRGRGLTGTVLCVSL